MSFRGVRLAGAVLAALIAGALPVVAAQAKGAARHPAARTTARDVGGRGRRQAVAADAGGVPYGGGPVLHWNRTHVIFWQPRGSGLKFDPGYETLIETFLRNVAAASHSASSVYGLSGQYTDAHGPAAYASSYGGAVVARDPLPPNRCVEPAAPPTSTGPGWSICLSDEQLQGEIERVVRRDHLAHGHNDIYFLVTPDGLGDCEYAGPDDCALGGTADGYCGYHAQTDDGQVIYAVIPYNAVPGHCQSDNPRPNGSTADPAISTISHEQNEMVTDPLGDAWIDPSSGEEIGDLCLTDFGPSIGGSGLGAWNETINGGHYYLQEEWSNYSGGCEPRAQSDWVGARFGLASTHSLSVWFAARSVAGQGRIVAYRWSFGDGRRSAGRVAHHRYRRGGRYRAVVRVTDSWGNWAFYAVTFTVARNGGRVVLETKSG